MNTQGHKPHVLEGITRYSKEDNAFIHYTCNAPTQEVLDMYGIEAIGQEYGCINSREVLKIPLRVYLDEGIPFTKDQRTLIINLENLMVILERGRKAAA